VARRGAVFALGVPPRFAADRSAFAGWGRASRDDFADRRATPLEADFADADEALPDAEIVGFAPRFASGSAAGLADRFAPGLLAPSW
jgi:hypothetical protein